MTQLINMLQSRSQWPRVLRHNPWSLERWDLGFEYRLRHGYFSSSIDMSPYYRRYIVQLLRKYHKTTNIIGFTLRPRVEYCSSSLHWNKTVDMRIRTYLKRLCRNSPCSCPLWVYSPLISYRIVQIKIMLRSIFRVNGGDTFHLTVDNHVRDYMVSQRRMP
jgi:hypothetical protein